MTNDSSQNERLSPMTTSVTRQWGSMLPICLGCAGFTLTLPANSRPGGKHRTTTTTTQINMMGTLEKAIVVRKVMKSATLN